MLAIMLSVDSRAVAQESADPETQSIKETGLEGGAVKDGSDNNNSLGWVQTILALALVAGLIVVAGWLLRRSGKFPKSISGGDVIEVVARKPLTTKEHLYLVRFAGKLHLIGCAPGCISKLSEASEEEISKDISAVEEKDE